MEPHSPLFDPREATSDGDGIDIDTPLWCERTPLFDQVIVNRYKPGEGIIEHVDLAKFDDGIVGISLKSACVMHFRRVPPSSDSCIEGVNGNSENGTDASTASHTSVTKVLLRPGDVYVLSGPARYEWTHSIPSEVSSCIRGEMVQREERVSITLRRMVPDWQPIWHPVPPHHLMYSNSAAAAPELSSSCMIHDCY
jgi:hypothetical protein